jgi:D-3-phosphoglycerate dehydrogenase
MGIEVINTPFGPTTAVAELTVALILDLLRKVSFMDRTVRSGGWEKIMGSLLSGKNVGIIGFGRIGEKVAALLEPFGCKIMYTDITRGAVKNFRNVPLTELLKKSDIVSIHVSSKETLISEKELMAMKKSALIVNMSRGEVVDESALYRALKDGHIGGAALDVFNEEPYGGPLKYLDNVVLTPHVGSYALEARIGMEIESVENLLKSLKGVK